MSVFIKRNNFELYKDVVSICIKDSKLEKLPEISICIPTYRRASTLKETIESALSQDTDIAYEIIIVDNNPERGDETEKILEKYNNVNNLSYYKNSNNIGMAGNWNRLFELAKAPWVLMIHDDDLVLPQYISVICQYLNPNIGCIIPQRIVLQEGKYINYNLNHRLSLLFGKMKRCYTIHNLYGTLSAPSGCLFNKNAVKMNGGFDETYYPSIDFAFYVLLSRNTKVYKLNETLYIYRFGVNESMKPETLAKFLELDYTIKRELFMKIFMIGVGVICKHFLTSEMFRQTQMYKDLFGIDIRINPSLDVFPKMTKVTHCIKKLVRIYYTIDIMLFRIYDIFNIERK